MNEIIELERQDGMNWLLMATMPEKLRNNPNIILFHQDGYPLWVWPIEQDRCASQISDTDSVRWIGRNGMQYPESEFTHYLLLVPPKPEEANR